MSSPGQVVNLPREVLRWIQSLDLAYSVKNVKRDFSNGFLVAEIFSRYYAKEIQMHSFDNGSGPKTKKDNWAQLMKVFRKVGLNDLTNEGEVHLITCAEEGAAVGFISKLYEVLTQRVVQTQIKKATVGREPGYLKEISVTKVRKALHRNDLGEDSDINTVSRVAFSAVDGHERSLQEDRMQDPERYSTTYLNQGPRVSQAMQRQSSVENDTTQPQVKVKEIQVKQLDRNVTHLRAMKQMQQGGSLQQGGRQNPQDFDARAVSPSGNEYGGGRSDSPSGTRLLEATPFDSPPPPRALRGMGPGMNPDNSLSLLNTCLARIMQPGCHPAWSAKLDPYNNFLAALSVFKSSKHVDEILRECLVEVGNSAQMLADASISTPKQFWKISDLFCAVIVSAPFDSLSYAAAIDSFQSIGRWVAVKDPVSALAMFSDFTLFKLTDTIIRNIQKRSGIMKLLHAFASQDAIAHVQCIKRLQSVVPDLPIFIHCLTILAVNETEFDDQLLDLYVYYATIAMGLSSPKLRAGAIAMLAAFVGRADHLIVPLLGQVRSLALSESWWEIHVHILSLCGGLLGSQFQSSTGTGPSHLSGGINDNWSQRMQSDSLVAVQDIVSIVLARNQSTKPVIQWAVSALAPGTYLGGDFNRSYLNLVENLGVAERAVLFAVSPSDMSRDSRRVVSTNDTIVLPSTIGAALVVTPVAGRWHPMAVAESLAAEVTSAEKDRLTAGQMHVVNCCFLSAVEYAKRNGSQLDDVFQGSWLESFEQLKSFIFVAFCDPSCYSLAASTCSTILFYSVIREKLFNEAKLVGALRLLYPLSLPSGVDLSKCQQQMENFLRETFSAGHPFNAATQSLLLQFSQNFASQFDKYPSVQQLLRELSRQLR